MGTCAARTVGDVRPPHRLSAALAAACTVAAVALAAGCSPSGPGASSGATSQSSQGSSRLSSGTSSGVKAPVVAGRPLVIGHRGSSATAPENTLASFRLGIRQGADFVESDVQRTKDGALVLMHDSTLNRTTDVEQRFPTRSPWRVGDFTLAEIETLDAGAWKSPRYRGEKVPTLDQVVQLTRHTRTGILMELKSPSLYPGIEAQVAQAWSKVPGYLRAALAAHRLMVHSFDEKSLHRYHDIQPEVPVGLIGTPPSTALPALAQWADEVNPSQGSFDAAYVAQAHRLGLRVLAWTVNSDSAMVKVLDEGVDGVITNRPDVLGTVVSRRSGSAARPAA